MGDLHDFSRNYSRWQTVDVGTAYLIDGGDPTITTRLPYVQERGDTAGSRIQIAYLNFHNRSGIAAHMAVGVRYPRAIWRAGQWTNSTSTYTDDTTDAQDRVGAGDFALETTTANDGHVILCRKPFNAVSYDITTAGAGASTVHAAHYSRGGTWVPLTNLTATAPQSAGQNWAVGEGVLSFQAPVDWEVTTGAEGTNIPAGYYAIRFQATTAPTTAALADSLTVHRMYFFTANVANNAVFELNLGGIYVPLAEEGEGLSYMLTGTTFGATVTHGSRLTVVVRSRG